MGEKTAARSAPEGQTDWPPGLVALFRDERTAFVRVAYLLTGRRGVAEEIVQDAFISLHRSWGPGAQPAGLSAYDGREWLSELGAASDGGASAPS